MSTKDKSTTKLNVLLAKTDHLQSIFRKLIEDYVKFFKTKQGEFRGERKTYQALPDTVDLPNERKNELVVTTVTEKLDWLVDNSKEYLDALFSQELTNAYGIAKATLVVEGQEWGEFTSLELLRLKSFLENGTLKELYENIPVRNDDEIWENTTEEMYIGRDIFESALLKGDRMTTVKETYILEDPNLSKNLDLKNYTPVTATRDKPTRLGEFTFQKFSGEWSHRQRAELLRRRSVLLTAVIEALKVCNEVEVQKSQLTADKIFSYLHKGKVS
ncbi:hypothetical protein QNI19_18245 [Cytophagaceae bacterium DM2B3-1]|uniref:Uncharacterized protein n=1 Tax=Xanthocytophaga flava TaxID=3048013 RepID=A0AAE3QK35_9BACT|nr:hypothetical protein [Xanthocytophaga flavus]MDJ1467375.1 hypothetical protein [Xanthocytophaga flavus]MDJ1480051.1 hypothetical protein [Xanthocytophaga flavus]MDJ1494886.1 hypothetical protein [Xanthocytophaga flavus]